MRFNARLYYIYVAAAGGVLLSGVGLFWITAANMSGSSLREALGGGIPRTVLLQTKFGTVCLIRAGLLVMLAALLPWLFRRRRVLPARTSAGEIAGGLGAAALLISNSFAGHAAAASGPSLPWRISVDVAHLLAAAVWPSGLFFLSLFLWRRRLSLAVLVIVKRFSQISFVTVGALALTGVANAWLLMGHVSALFTSGYGRVLVLKLSLFLVILFVAVINRYRVVPALFSYQASAPDSRALKSLLTFVLIEFAVAAAIIVVVAVLGITPPPR